MFTAKLNDLLCVTGDLGAAYMGLLLLEREKHVFKADPSLQPDLESHDYILGRQLKPDPRADVIQMFKKMKIKPTAMIDISDGLGSEVLHICHDSGLGCRIYQEKIPLDPTTVNMAAEFNMSVYMAALNGGEDYELLFTIGQEDHEKVSQMPDVSIIGHMTDKSEGVQMVTLAEELIEIKAQGWDTLRKREL